MPVINDVMGSNAHVVSPPPSHGEGGGDTTLLARETKGGLVWLLFPHDLILFRASCAAALSTEATHTSMIRQLKVMCCSHTHAHTCAHTVFSTCTERDEKRQLRKKFSQSVIKRDIDVMYSGCPCQH